MGNIGLNEVGDALIIMVGLLVIAITIVTLVLWGVFKFFYHKPDRDKALGRESSD